MEWEEKIPDARHNWLTEGLSADFESFLPLGSKDTKNSKRRDVQNIFKTFFSWSFHEP